MNAKTLSIVAILLWGVSAAFIGYRFMVGSTVTDADGREAVMLTAGERDFILAEMRGMLVGVQEIISAVNVNDMEAVKETAYRIGTAEVEGVPPETMLKLPMAFKRLGMSTHQGFDAVGLAADMDGIAVLEALEENLAKCVACHEGYRLQAE